MGRSVRPPIVIFANRLNRKPKKVTIETDVCEGIICMTPSWLRYDVLPADLLRNDDRLCRFYHSSVYHFIQVEA